MRGRLQDTLRRASGGFGSFTAGQKAVTVLALVGMLVGGVLFARWAGAPTYTPLFSNLASTDASAIVDELAAEGTPYQLTDGGRTILVPQDSVYDLRLRMSGKGLPSEQDSGYSLLDKQGVTASDFQKQVTYQRAPEGEIASTVMAIDGVRSAVVHLAIPRKDVFADEESKPTASVLVEMAPGKDMAPEQVQAVVHLVSSSVEGLEPEKVTLADAEGKVLNAPGTAAAGTAGDVRASMTSQYEQRLAAALQRMLDQVVGPNRSVATVTADLDSDSTETRTEKYSASPSTPPQADSQNTETYTGGAAPGAGAGVLGPDNVQVPAGSASPGAYKKESRTRNNMLDKVTEQRRSAPGAVQRLNVAVLLDARTAKSVDQQQVRQLISSAAGIDAKRGDTLEVAQMPFDETAAKATAKELAEARAAEQKAGWMSTARTPGLVLTIVVLVLLAMRSTRKKRRASLTQVELERLDEMQELALEGAAARAAISVGGGTGGTRAPVAIGPGPDQRTTELASWRAGELA